MAEVFQNRDQNIKHVELLIAAHRLWFFSHRSSFGTHHRRCAALQRVARAIMWSNQLTSYPRIANISVGMTFIIKPHTH